MCYKIIFREELFEESSHPRLYFLGEKPFLKKSSPSTSTEEEVREDD